MKAVAVFFAMACATTIYTNLDTVMLGFMKTDMDVGYYNAAIKIKTVLLGIVTSLGNVLMPRVSYYAEHERRDEFLQLIKKAIHFVILLAVPMTMYFILYAKESICFLSGDAYEGATLPMQIIMPTVILIGLTGIMGIQVLVPLGKEHLVLYSEMAGVIVDLALNAVLIPRFGASGAAIGTLAAELVVWIVQFIILRDLVIPMYRTISYWKVIVAGIIACVAAGSIKLLAFSNVITLLISAIIFGGVYVGGLIILKESTRLDEKNAPRYT
jgi:O-antigen/teichoic acid export membrane protein